MPKLIKENPAYFIIPAIILVIGAVFFFVKKTESASEWEKVASPPNFTEVELHDVVAYFNEDNSKYYAWAVGKKDNTPEPSTGVIFTYDPVNRVWLAEEFEDCTSLNGIALFYDSGDLVVPYKLWAVGDSGVILHYKNWSDGPRWGYQCKANCDDGLPSETMENWTGKNLKDVSFYYDEGESKLFGWVVGDEGECLDTTDSGNTWGSRSLSITQTLNSVQAVDKNNVWTVGNGDRIFKWDGIAWNFSVSPLGNTNHSDVFFVEPNKGWIAVNTGTYLYFSGGIWTDYETKISPVSPVSSLTAVSDGKGNYYLWLAGNEGKIIFSKFSNPTSATWNIQATDVFSHLYGIFALNSTHAWAVGEESTILKVSPGNISGWAYVGADNCSNICADLGGGCTSLPCEAGDNADRTFPLGWISLNCANQKVCDTTTFSYGVNIKKKKKIECIDPAEDRDVAALSGYAWFGKNDPFELPPGVTCNLGENKCSNNGDVWCDEDTDCTCSYNLASCYSTGWLSFDRNDTSRPPASPYNQTIGETLTTPCNKDIIIGTDPEDYIIATFDYDSYALEGWARFKLGLCLNDSSVACFKDEDCGTGNTCVYKNKDIAGNEAEGWLKLRGGDKIASPPTYPGGYEFTYYPCQACRTIDPNGEDENSGDDNGDEYLVCKICEGINVNDDGKRYFCNKCGNDNTPLCGTGRCGNKPEETCLINPDSDKDRCWVKGQEKGEDWGLCEPSGICSATSPFPKPYAPCTKNDHCKVGVITGLCEFLEGEYNTCNVCLACDQYGVSVDIEAGQWYGYAYSEDFGWIDMSKIGLYNTAWIRTEFGDIYSRTNIGSPRSATAPGYAYSALACNASYLILAGGRIINYCSEQILASERGPSFEYPTDYNKWVIEGYRAFDLPKETKPHAILGTIDYEAIVNMADVTYSEDQTSGGIDGIFTPQPYQSNQPYRLNGEIIYIEGNLTINEDLEFDRGGGDGSGLIVVNGNLIIEANISYSTALIEEINQLPSAGFYVKGDIIISPSVNSMVGSYYCENRIITESKGLGNLDNQLKVFGLMISSEFNFKRRFKGTIDNPQPAEWIIYDGRIQANPPPGFRDLSKVLPRLRETIP